MSRRPPSVAYDTGREARVSRRLPSVANTVGREVQLHRPASLRSVYRSEGGSLPPSVANTVGREAVYLPP